MITDPNPTIKPIDQNRGWVAARPASASIGSLWQRSESLRTHGICGFEMDEPRSVLAVTIEPELPACG